MQEAKQGSQKPIYVAPLGQAGFRFEFEDVVVYVDPYLSDRVAEIQGEHLRRLAPPRMKPDEVKDADFVLITHIHLDHCDPATILPIYQSSPGVIFIGPNEVGKYLEKIGIDGRRITTAGDSPIRISNQVNVRPVQASHPEPERDGQNLPRHVGYVFEYYERKIYHAGDTSPHTQLLSDLKKLSPIDVAFLPVNERNFYRASRGILGNMSIREAFQMAEDIGVKILVPMHWDMFALNATFTEEIELLYKNIRPPFQLIINPRCI